MAFGDEDLTGLRAQLIGAGYDPTGERYLGLGAAPPASSTSRQVTGDRAPSHGPVLGSSEPAPRASAVGSVVTSIDCFALVGQPTPQ